MRLKFFTAALLAVCLLLGACKDQGSAAAPAPATTTASPVSIAAIEAQAKGFAVGVPMSARTVYVFFDPQCPHCTELWEAARPLKNQTRFVWIPVGILNASSTAQGAALLAAADPEAAMNAHEASMRAKTGGIGAAGSLAPQKALVLTNTELLTRFGFGSIPTIVASHAQSGALLTHEGALSTAALASFLGLQAPAADAAASAPLPPAAPAK